MAPTLEHEFLIELVRHRPSLVTTLLTEMGVPVPEFDEARLESPDFTECTPTEYRADAVVVLANGKPLAGIVLEVQRRHREEKQWSWPVYLATLRKRIKGPCLLLVFCPDSNEARKCASAIEMGHPGWTLIPIVIGPNEIPKITDIVRAIAEPELATLSAIVHGQTEEGFKVLQTFFDALEQQPEEVKDYADLVISMLPGIVFNTFMEFNMAMGTREPRSQLVRHWVNKGRAEGWAEGLVEGKTEAVLQILQARDVLLYDQAVTRISECTDPDIIEGWIKKALTVEKVEELFDFD